MILFLLRRSLTMAVTLAIISALVFFIIKLPPGDFLTNQIAELRAQGEAASAAKAEFLIKQYGLDRPVWEQYLIWIGVWPGPEGGFNGLLQGNWGWSFEYDKPVNDVVGDALWLTLLVNIAVVIFVHLVSIPIAIYSATRQYSLGDYFATFIGYIGLATPSFLLALILLFYSNRWFGISIGGLYDPAYANQPWSWGKVQSLASHLIVPTLVIGLGGTAAMIRRMRANLLDELGKQYYVTAKAKGLPPRKALLKYPFRMSLNPFISDIGNLLPHLVSGSILVSLVLSLPTVGPILLAALKTQDQFLAGFILMFVAMLTVVGMLISDLLLAWLDPRIRLGGQLVNIEAPARPRHYVDTAPFDPGLAEPTGAESEAFYRASSWKLMWWKFRRHKVAVASAFVLLAFYLMVPFVEAIAPYNQTRRNGDFLYAPPQGVHLFHEGRFVGPFVYPYKFTFNLETFKRDYVFDKTTPQALRFFCRSDAYEMWGVIHADFHLFCPPKDGTLFIAGTDRLGRDLFSRIIYGARISLTIGLVGIAVSFALGLFFGGVAGYLGGWVDHVVQRMIEILRSLPELPLWLALSAALPPNWSPVLVFFGITIILGLLDWPGLARAVRSKLLALREEDFVRAAELMGASKKRIIARHLIPNFMSHLIASATLSIPSMILGETALSFLGLGLRPPVTSWGVLLNEAQNLAAVQLHPWLLFPILPVVIVVLAFNFMGDGLRDAADPYH